jgi:FtsZ-binding cell division protein ZapB
MELKQHPLSAAFPAMSAEDFAALVDDVKAHGQREPIMLFEGMVLDGWHRYQACEKLGVRADKFEFKGEDPAAFVLSHNLHRRHLTPSQRAAAVVACSDWVPKGRPAGKPETISGFREKDMAKLAGTSDRTIRDAKAAHKAGLGEAVKEGALTAHEAAAVARGKQEPKPKRQLDVLPANVVPLVASDELAEAQHTVTELAQENEQLRDRLAVEAMDASEEEKTLAGETIKELRARVKTLEAELSAVKASRDSMMRTEGELKKQVAYWRKKAEKVAA